MAFRATGIVLVSTKLERIDCGITIGDLLSLFEYIIIVQSNTSFVSLHIFYITKLYDRGETYIIGGDVVDEG
jgi:hypothetical protein